MSHSRASDNDHSLYGVVGPRPNSFLSALTDFQGADTVLSGLPWKEKLHGSYNHHGCFETRYRRVVVAVGFSPPWSRVCPAAGRAEETRRTGGGGGKTRFQLLDSCVYFFVLFVFLMGVTGTYKHSYMASGIDMCIYNTLVSLLHQSLSAERTLGKLHQYFSSTRSELP